MEQRTLPKITDTYLYTMINKSGSLENILKQFLSKSVVATQEQLYDEYASIRRYFKYPLVTTILEEVNEGGIEPRFLPEVLRNDFKIPIFLPFLLVSAGGSKVRPIAVIDNYITRDKGNDSLTIDPKKLYVLLEGAYIASKIHKNFHKLNNTTLYTHGCSLFAHMFARVLNKKFALNVEKTAFAKVIYIAAKYYFINILRMPDSDMVQNYAMKEANISVIAVKEVDEAFTEEHFQNIGEFITRLNEVSYLFTHGLRQLTVRNYIDGFIEMYGSSSIFALEHFSYFIFNIFSAVNGGFLNNQYAFDDILGTSGDKLYAYIVNFVK